MNKSAVREQILLRLRAELELQTRAANVSRDEAISEESQAENRWDTHSQEAAYLAEGQARLVADIAESIKLYESLDLSPVPAGAPIAIGALVEVSNGEQRTWYFIGPRGGGIELDLEGLAILVLTPQSPFGRVLLGKRAGDSVQLPGRGASASQQITAIL